LTGGALIVYFKMPDVGPKNIGAVLSRPAFPRSVRDRVAHEPDFGLNSKGVVGMRGAPNGRCGG
jgi:hypothetical protein